MKPLTLEETKLKEEMKERCLAKGQYIDKNAKAKFEILCHLEDFEVQYWELQKENEQLKDNWNKLKEYLNYKSERAVGEDEYVYDEIYNEMQEMEKNYGNVENNT